MAGVTWQCPQCGRRVPNRVAECHCGMRREAALAAPTAPSAPFRGGAGGRGEADVPRPVPALYRFAWRNVPRDVKFMAVGLVVVLLAGLGFLFVPWKPKPVVPLLGWSEPATGRRQSPPPPAPKRAPSPAPSPKKGWLPW